MPEVIRALDFFAGSGLVTSGLKPHLNVVWANDICEKKAASYVANHGSAHFELGSIECVSGNALPSAEVAWASFPCQDLSLAGKRGGLRAERSGLYWQWLRVLDEMQSLPKVVVLENVVGLLSANAGKDFIELQRTLEARNYLVGAMVLNAVRWVPQSRPRLFVVAARSDLDTDALQDSAPNWLHPARLIEAVNALESTVWWSVPQPTEPVRALGDVVEWEAPSFSAAKVTKLLGLVSERHSKRISSLPAGSRCVFPGYKRTRAGKQVLELRFDGIAGCLRTAEGGSSRQFLLLWDRGKWRARLLTGREAARLMGASEDFKLVGSYNDVYSSMGDAVAAPVVAHIAEHLLVPLAQSKKRKSGARNKAKQFCLRA